MHDKVKRVAPNANEFAQRLQRLESFLKVDPTRIGEEVQDLDERLHAIEKAASVGTPGDGINLFNVHKLQVHCYIFTFEIC